MRQIARGVSWSLLASVAGLFAACGGGGDGGGPLSPGAPSGAYCNSVSGGGAQLTADCAGCTVENQGAAVDDKLSSNATVRNTAPAVNAVATLRATAQPGVVYPASGQAGVFFTALADVCDNCGVVINTYLAGARQESQSGVTNSQGTGTPADRYAGVPTTKPFDAVEVVVTGSVTSSAAKLAEIYEICSDGGFR